MLKCEDIWELPRVILSDVMEFSFCIHCMTICPIQLHHITQRKFAGALMHDPLYMQGIKYNHFGPAYDTQSWINLGKYQANLLSRIMDLSAGLM